MPRKSKTRPDRGSARVQGWIYGVINPLLHDLEGERRLLASGNPGWRFLNRRLEFVLPPKDHLDPSGLVILEDLERACPTPGLRIEEHGGLVHRLEQAAVRFHDDLVGSPGFVNAVERAIREFGTASPGAEPWGAYTRDQFPALVAERLINNVERLPAHHSDAAFWEKEGPRLRAGFLIDRDSPAAQRGLVRPSGASLIVFRKTLERTRADGQRLISDLRDLRYELCEKYDVPAAPVPGMTACRPRE